MPTPVEPIKMGVMQDLSLATAINGYVSLLGRGRRIHAVIRVNARLTSGQHHLLQVSMPTLSVILSALLFPPACMRRFIVIFLLLLLPLQVLAESVEDLRATHHSAIPHNAVDGASTNVDVVLNHSPSSPDVSNFQQAVHADISDSVNSAEFNVPSPLSAEGWLRPRLRAIPTVYLPVIKPPLI